MKYYVIDVEDGTITPTTSPGEALKVVNKLLKEQPEEVETDIENKMVTIIKGEELNIGIEKTFKAKILD